MSTRLSPLSDSQKLLLRPKLSGRGVRCFRVERSSSTEVVGKPFNWESNVPVVLCSVSRVTEKNQSRLLKLKNKPDVNSVHERGFGGEAKLRELGIVTS